jgi:hypothetical protein
MAARRDLKGASEIRVQPGIPMPPVKQRGPNGRGVAKYPWREMKVGDSFLFPESIQRQAYAAAGQAQRLTGWRFAVRCTGAGYRCWRIA